MPGKRGTARLKEPTQTQEVERFPALSVPADTPLREAVRLLSEEAPPCLVLVERGQVAGIVTPQGVLRRLNHGAGWDEPVALAAESPAAVLAEGEDTPAKAGVGPVVYLAGKVPTAVLCRCANFTQLERRWREASREMGTLRELNGELEAILRASYDGVVVTDRERVLRVSEGFRRITGLPMEVLVGRPVGQLPAQGHACVRAVRQVIERVWEVKEPVTLMEKISSGNEIYFTGVPVLDEAGRVERVVVNVRDVTDLNLLRSELAKVRDLSDQYKSELEELRARQLQTQDLVAESSGMRRVLDLTARVARTDSTVLITGESGVGKEVVAKLLHRLSARREAPLIFVNCGALPETLVESELFGYARGAFTGAREEGKPGLFEVADRGTLVLDEVSELPAGAQAKLLRVIQEREITRVGGLKPRQLDVRVVALSNRDLGQMVQEGTFREDLYYRLNVVPIAVPPLRERREDILPLLRRFLDRCGQRYGLRRRFSLEAFRRLERHPWPGNVRELEHVVERAVVLGEGEVIDEAAVETFLNLNGLS